MKELQEVSQSVDLNRTYRQIAGTCRNYRLFSCGRWPRRRINVGGTDPMAAAVFALSPQAAHTMTFAAPVGESFTFAHHGYMLAG
mgnify:CR=1 FL=1